jgi:hypothetical protein
MIHTPFDPRAGVLTVALLGQLAIAVGGLTLMFRATKLATRLILLGVFLAVAAGLLPGWTR